MKFSLAFRNLIDEIIGCWCGSFANYGCGGYFDIRGETALKLCL